MSLLEVTIKQAGYEKDQQIINDIQFSLESGEWVGIIGSNGAGKSTTIKAILGLLANLDGTVAFRDDASYAYIPERPIFYDEMTLWEHFDFIAAVEGLDNQRYWKNIESMVKLYGMASHVHEYPGKYSKGMQQKAMLLLAMASSPEIYIIDEPFMGLDPHAMKLFLQSVQAEKERGVGILMTTHVLDTAEKICDRFILIDQGRLRAMGTLAEIQKECNLPNGSLYECFHSIAQGSEIDNE